MIRNMLLGMAAFGALLATLFAMALAQTYLAHMLNRPFGDIVFGTVLIAIGWLILEALRRFAR